MLNDVTVFNIRDYLSAKGDKDFEEDELRQLLSEFFCDKNPDVERFLKEQSIEFTKKNQSVTYLVFSNDDVSLVGYFTLTIRPITVNAENFSNTIKREIARVSELDEEKIMHFYEYKNEFKSFDTKETKFGERDIHTLV